MKIRELVERVFVRFEIENFWLNDWGYVSAQNATGSTVLVIAHKCESTINVSLQGWCRHDVVPLIEVDILIRVRADAWEVMDIAYSPAAWDEYLICAPTDGLLLFDEVGRIIKESFADYWALKLMTSGWLRQCVLDDVVLEEPIEEVDEPVEAVTERQFAEAPAITAVNNKGYQLALF